jgi:hypothetical protein
MDEDEIESGFDSGQALTRNQVMEQLSSITKQTRSKYGGNVGALEDAYAYFLNLYGDQINFADVADFFGGNMTAEEIRAQYLPETGYEYGSVFDSEDFDFDNAMPGAPPPLKSSRSDENKAKFDDNFKRLLDRIADAGTTSPLVASDALSLDELLSPQSIQFRSPEQDFRTLNPGAGRTTVADLQRTGRLASGLFDPLNFPKRDITRGTPVVTRGLDAQGNPTTAITMGQSTATGTGPNIGELNTFTQFPSTGMGINPDGTGTATVGTLDTTGNIVATGADTLNMFDSGMGNVSTVDDNVLNIGTGLGDTNTLKDVTTNQIKVNPAGGPAFEKDIQNIFRTSNTKDIAAQRIGDLAVRTGGLTAQQIADAVNPLIAAGERPSFNLGSTISAPSILEYASDYKTGLGPEGGRFITETAAAAPVMPNYAPPSEEIVKFFDDPTRAIGEGEYTSQEAGARALDFAKAQGLTLAQAADAFGLTEEQAKQRAQELGLNLTAFGFKHGGPVSEPSNAYDEFRMSVSMGPDEMAMQRRQQGVQNILSRRAGVQPSEQMLSKLDRIMGR